MHPKKSLGQHFLIDPRVLAKIIETAAVLPGDTVLEVGPGGGVLTEALLATGCRVIAVEKDEALADALRKRYADQKRLMVVSGDILDFRPEACGLAPRGFLIVANIPYYITGRFLRTFLESSTPPSRMVLMLQKEVADRLTASRESLLSISVKAYGEPRYIETVPAAAFRPKPKVDSAILRIDVAPRKSTDDFGWLALAKRGFSHPRKLVKSNLGLDETPLAACGIRPDARAEGLSTRDWICVYEKTKK